MRALTILLTVVACAAIAGCGDDDSREPTTPGELAADPGPIHVHGLGINPADGALFIATHTGLFRAADGDTTATRVGDRYQDTMGFTIVGPDRFLGSGHPDPREELPPYLGLIQSQDAGANWDPVSLLGESDFHVLEAAGESVYGYGSDFDSREPQLLVSTDGGRHWQKRALPERPTRDGLAESILSLAINPDDADHVVASGQQALWWSADQGRHWRFLSADAGLLAWPERGVMYLVDVDGGASRSTDGGRSWTPVGDAGGSPAAFEATTDGSLLVALHDDGRIMQSHDGGESWQLRSQP